MDDLVEGFAPCPVCKQYSHTIGSDLMAEAALHFKTLIAHPVRGTPMGDVFDDRTKDMAERLLAEIERLRAELAAYKHAALESLYAGISGDQVQAEVAVEKLIKIATDSMSEDEIRAFLERTPDAK